MKSYKTLTNVLASHTFGTAPNVTEMLHSIEIMDANGTEHEIRPRNNIQNRETEFVNMVL